MDFRGNSANQQQQSNTRPAGEQPAHGGSPLNKNFGKRDPRSLVKAGSFVLLVLITALVAALLVVISTSGSASADKESGLVDNSKMQAVFLTNGQVYFGKINSINDQYIDLGQIYYLTTNTQVQPNQTQNNQQQNNGVQLVKLGCELHAPQDQMTINRDQVTFWENLKDDGQVAAAVKTFKDQNPNGQTCNTNNQSQSQTQTQTQGTTNNQQ